MRIPLFFTVMLFFSSIVAMETTKKFELLKFLDRRHCEEDIKLEKLLCDINIEEDRLTSDAREGIRECINSGLYNKDDQPYKIWKCFEQKNIVDGLKKEKEVLEYFFNIRKQKYTKTSAMTMTKEEKMFISGHARTGSCFAQCYLAVYEDNNSALGWICKALENMKNKKLYDVNSLNVMEQTGALEKLLSIVNGKGKSKNARKIKQKAKLVLANLYNNVARQKQQQDERQNYFNQANDLYKQLLENPQTALEAAKKLMCNALYGNGKFKQHPVKVVYEYVLRLEKSKIGKTLLHSVYIESFTEQCITRIKECADKGDQLSGYASYILASYFYKNGNIEQAGKYFEMCKKCDDKFAKDPVVQMMMVRCCLELSKDDVLDVFKTVSDKCKDKRFLYAQTIACQLIQKIVGLDFETLFSNLNDYNQLISPLRKALNNIKDSETQSKLESHLAQLYFQRGKIHKNSGSTKKMISDFCDSFRYGVKNPTVMRILLNEKFRYLINIKQDTLVSKYLSQFDDNKVLDEDFVRLVDIVKLYLPKKETSEYEIFETGNSGKANTKFAFDALKLLVRIPVNLQKKDNNLQYFIAANKILGEWYTGKNKFVNENLKEAILCFENVKSYDITVYPNLVGSYFKNGQSERAEACLNELAKKEHNKKIDNTEFNKVVIQCNWFKVLETFEENNNEEMLKCLKIILEKSVDFRKLDWILDLTPKNVFKKLQEHVENNIKTSSNSQCNWLLVYFIGEVLYNDDNKNIKNSLKLGEKYVLLALDQKFPFLQLLIGIRRIKLVDIYFVSGINNLGNALLSKDEEIQKRALNILEKMPFNILSQYYLFLYQCNKNNNIGKFLEGINIINEGLKYVDKELRKKSEPDNARRMGYFLNEALQVDENIYNALVKESDKDSKEATFLLALVHHFQRIGLKLDSSDNKNLEDLDFVQKLKIEIKYVNRLRNLLNDEEKKLYERLFDKQFERQLVFFAEKDSHYSGKNHHYYRYFLSLNDISWCSNEEYKKYFLEIRKEILENFNDKKNIQLWWLKALEAFKNENYEIMHNCIEKIMIKVKTKTKDKTLFSQEKCFGILNAELIDSTIFEDLKKYIKGKIKQADYTSEKDARLAFCLGTSLKASCIENEFYHECLEYFAKTMKTVHSNLYNDYETDYREIIS